MSETVRDAVPAHAVAIIGLAGRFPDADDLDVFWRNIAAGVESLTTFSDADLDAADVPAALRANPNYVRRGTAFDQAEYFDASFFGISPREAQILDPQHRVFLECAWEALEHAGYAVGDVPEAVGVYAGASMNSYVYFRLMQNPALASSVGDYQIMLGNDKDFLCTRVSYKLDLHGPSMGIQTACSTSLVAVHAACRALQRNECDMALAGGVSLTFPGRAGYLYQEGMILSPDGRCRPFDAEARGTRPGAGAGIVVLKRLADALADNDTVHAVIRGIAINNDGAGKAGFTAPSVNGQVEVVATAQALAGVSPRSIAYVEAHGTATPLGDPIEIAALTRVFRATTDDVGFCRLGSLKANLGHLDVAAGVAGLIKTVLALKHRTLPPLVNFQSGNPALQLDRSPFTASAVGCPWEVDGDTPRRAGVSSFGIGGTNAHAVLEEAPLGVPPPPSAGPQLLLLSARSEAALDAATERLADHLQAHPEQDLADVAWTLQRGRVAFPVRRALVAASAAKAITLLRTPQRPPVWSGRHEGGARPVAFLFSGQGSQYAGMGRDLYAAHAVYREAIDRCALLLQPLLGEDIRLHLHADDDSAALTETRLTQPALFAVEYALASLWRHWGVVPTAMLGHSVGEYVAAHLAGVMSLPAALTVVASRGRLMQQQAPGGMATVHLAASDLGGWLGAGVEVAAVNAPGLCTVSGPSEAITALLGRLADAGIEARALHTSHAFHSAMMEPALAGFTAVFDGVALSAPTVPYVSNLSGTWITPQQATSPAYYADHLRRAVQFEAGMRTLAADAALHFVEVGPGAALTSLARMNLGPDGGRRVVASMRRATDARNDDEALLEAAGRLWLAGSTLNWSALHAERRRRVPLPTYAFERKRHSVDRADRPVSAAPSPGPADVGPATNRPRPVEDWLWIRTWQRAGRLPQRPVPAALAGARWLVFHDEAASSLALVDAWRGQGIRVLSVLPGDGFVRDGGDQFRVRAGTPADIERVLHEVEADGPCTAVVHAWNATGPADLTRSPDLDTARRFGIYSLLDLGQALAGRPRDQVLPVIVLSTDRESVFGQEPLRPERSLLLGPAYLLPIDVPRVRCRSIDLASADWADPAHAATLAAPIAAEVANPDREVVVGYRFGYRWLPVTAHQPHVAPAAAAPWLHDRGTYLITGGTGGLGLTFAAELARSCSARLVLTARTALPERAQWDRLLADPETSPALQSRLRRLKELEDLGAELLICVADVSDPAQMASAIAAAGRRFGAIRGVIHAAGELGTHDPLQQKSRESVEAVLRPKVEGTLVLDELFAASRLDFLVLCSSISTSFGSQGMSDYSSANAFQDAFARSGRARSTDRVVSIGWDSWRDVGFAVALGGDPDGPALRNAIAAHEGAQALGIAMAAGLPHVYVSRQDMPAMLSHVEALTQWLLDSRAAPRAATPAAPSPTPTSSLPGDDGAASSEVEHRITAIWRDLIGIDDISLDADFFQLGGHSLMATRVLARIEEALGVRLSLRDIFDAPTIRGQAARVAALRGGLVASALIASDDREEIEF